MKLERNNLAWFIVGICLGVVATAVTLTLLHRTSPAPIVIVPPQPSATPGPIQVFVNGAVRQPGVYALPQGSRLQDALTAAGGVTDEAQTAVLNLAQPLNDGVQLFVPTIGEETSADVPLATAVFEDDAANTVASGDLININTADVATLDVLPHIGPSTAGKIIAYREANGPFAKIEDIMNVSGIGPATFDDIKNMITVGP